MPNDFLDIALRHVVELPPHHALYRVELLRVPRPPQRDRVSLVEHPSDREGDDLLAITFTRVPIERCHGRKVLREPGFLELRIAAAQVVAFEMGRRADRPGQKPSAQGAVTEDGNVVLSRV